MDDKYDSYNGIIRQVQWVEALALPLRSLRPSPIFFLSIQRQTSAVNIFQRLRRREKHRARGDTVLDEGSESAAEFPEQEQHQCDDEQHQRWRGDDHWHAGKNGDEQRREGDAEKEADNLRAAARLPRVVVFGLLVAHDEEAGASEHGDEADDVADVERGGDAHQRSAGDEPADEAVGAEHEQDDGADGDAAHEGADVALLAYFFADFGDGPSREGFRVSDARGDAAAALHLGCELLDDVELDNQRLLRHQTGLVHALEDITHEGFVVLAEERKELFGLFGLFDFQLS